MILNFNFEDLRWASDWMGYEVGYPEVNVVGLYGLTDTNVYFYIDMETMEVLEYWTVEED